MKNIFLLIYEGFLKRKYSFGISIAVITVFIAIFASQLRLEEDVKAVLPQDARLKNINLVLNNSKFADKIIVTLSGKDTKLVSTDSLESVAEAFVNKLSEDTSLIKKIDFRVDQSTYLGIYDFFYKNLPFYLSEKDYTRLDTLFTEENIQTTLNKNFKTLISPAGLVTKKYILKDPYSITPLALEKLKAFQLDKNFEVFNECVFTKDRKHLMVFLEPKYSSSNTKENSKLIDKLDEVIDSISIQNPSIHLEYYGGTAVAVANAKRIKTDIMLTLSIVFVLIIVLLYLYFKNLKLIALMFLPVAFGFGIAISIISLTVGPVSAIAFGIGAILVGISVDYPLYVFTQFKNQKSIAQILKELSLPLLMCSITSSAAFLCLNIIPSTALNQIGMFGALSVMSTALFVLIFIPYLLTKLNKDGKIQNAKSHTYLLDHIAKYPIENTKFLFYAVLVLSVVFIYFSNKPNFNSDIATLNYMPTHLQEAENNLTQISSESKSAVYFVSIASTMEEALHKAERVNEKLENSEIKLLYKSKSSGADLILSKEQQQYKIDRWNSFWDKVNRDKVELLTKKNGANLKFKDTAFDNFYNLINQDFVPVGADEFQSIQETFLSNYVNSNDSVNMVITILKVDKENKDALFAHFEADDDVVIFDKQHFSNNFFNTLKENFGKLVNISMLLVFILILISLGRIELALIVMIPVYLSWLWTLGLMGIFNIEFNIFNIIITTFIFGSGVDYCIITLQGLQNNYKYGNHSLKPYRLSILLSSRTSLIGVASLLFAFHPALRSIALPSIFSIASVVFLSNVLIPRLFHLITMKTGKLRESPVTLFKLLSSLHIYLVLFNSIIVIGLFIPVLILIPVGKRKTRLLFHYIITYSCRIILFLNPQLKTKLISKEKLDFSQPKILVSNHQSIVDLILLLQLNPRIIVLTKKHVWFNPFFGFIVRYAEYFPVYKGIESGLDRIKQKVNEGYSVLVFPEGTRTKDGKISRFHQGAFYLADKLNLDIQPILICGANLFCPKSELLFNIATVSITIFDSLRVDSVDIKKGETYKAQAMNLTRFMREQLQLNYISEQGSSYFQDLLRKKYIYKGPVLEWYVKLKLKLEGGYKYYNQLIPSNAIVLDIGCGYGYFAYLLSLTSSERIIHGVDYDEEKISLAKNIAHSNRKLSFSVMDIETEEIPQADVYTILDVLHYMPKQLQFLVLRKCMQNLSDDGFIILRDADADLTQRTKVTKQTEFHSTKLFKFNKTKHDLTFISGKELEEFIRENNCTFERVDNAKYTSNITYVIRR